MNVDVITQYILTIAPAATAIISVVVALVVGIKKMKNVGDETVISVETSNKNLKEENAQLRHTLAEVEKENLDIKLCMDKLMAKVSHLHFTDKED